MLKNISVFSLAAIVAIGTTGKTNAATSQAFTVTATVNTTASITFPSSFTYGFTASDNTNAHLGSANNNSTNVINVDAVSSASTGAVEIYFTAPASVPGTHSNSIPIGAFTYQCSGTYTLNTGINGAQSTTTVTASGFTTVVSPGNNDCIKLTGGSSVASTSLILNLFMDDRFEAADTYSSSGFAVAVTST